jgi:class 3 adenylate cyclase
MSVTPDTHQRTTLAEWLGAKPGKPTQVTILFTDIVTSTKLSNKIGDKDWVERLMRHFNHGLGLVAEHDGYKIKFIGDAFMVAFKSPVSALNFAMAFHKNTGDELIKIRACIHSGTARIIDDDIFGRMINYAARMLSWKKDDGVIVSNTAKEALDGEFGLQRAKEIFVKQTAELKDFPTQPVWLLDLDEWWVKRIMDDLPDIREVRGVSCGPGCMLRPARLEDIKWIANLQARTYKERDTVPEEILRVWHQTNPNGFSIMEAEEEEMIGHIIILPLKPAAIALLLNGNEPEYAITPEMLYRPHEQSRIEVIYIESIIVKDQYKELQQKALLALLTNFSSLVSRVCSVEQAREVYQVPMTDKGERLIQQLGFRLVGPADERIDKHPLYVATLKDIRSNIETMLSAPPDEE